MRLLMVLWKYTKINEIELRNTLMLHLGARKTIELLIEKNASVDGVNLHGDTPLLLYLSSGEIPDKGNLRKE